jgi:hypothetical protein
LGFLRSQILGDKLVEWKEFGTRFDGFFNPVSIFAGLGLILYKNHLLLVQPSTVMIILKLLIMINGHHEVSSGSSLCLNQAAARRQVLQEIVLSWTHHEYLIFVAVNETSRVLQGIIACQSWEIGVRDNWDTVTCLLESRICFLLASIKLETHWKVCIPFA